jgi:hypothetical protein
MMSKTAHKTSAEAWLDSLDVTSTQLRDGKHLRAIGRSLDAYESAEASLYEAVEAARAAGESWAAIGVVLGTSKQAVQPKFGRGRRTA